MMNGIDDDLIPAARLLLAAGNIPLLQFWASPCRESTGATPPMFDIGQVIEVVIDGHLCEGV